MSRKFILLIAISVFISFNIKGQPSNLGTLPIVSYSKKETKAGTQTWDIETDDYGYTWFGNNAGLVRFDGYEWDVFPMPNKTIVRSLAVDNTTHTVYVGSQGDFGYWKPEKNGSYKYHSLLSSIPKENQEIEEVWNVIHTDQGVFFRTDWQVFRYHNGKVTALLDGKKMLNFIGMWGRQVVIQDINNHLFNFDGTKFQPKNPSVFNQGRISSVVNYINDTILITTINNGIFYETPKGFLPWKTNNDQLLKNNRIFCAGRLDKERIAIGTSFSGLIIIDKNRKIEYLIDKQSGIQNNSVLSISTTSKDGIWLGLDNGIDLIQHRSPFRLFFPDGKLQGTGYASVLHNGKLYLGTNTGLYQIPWKHHYYYNEKNQFTKIDNTDGQVWNLQLVNDELWMCHHNGLFRITENMAERVSNLTGVWKIIKTDQNQFYAGNYHGIASFMKKQGQWQLDGTINGFKESSRILEMDQLSNLWIAHPYKGIFQINKNDLQSFETKNNLYNASQTNNNKIINNIFKINEFIVTSNKDSFFYINPITCNMEKFDLLNKFINTSDGIKFLEQDKSNNIWFGTRNEIGVLVSNPLEKNGYKKYIVNELTGRLTEGFQKAFEIDKENIIFPTEKGFLLFNSKDYFQDTTNINLFISKILLKSSKDSILYQGNIPYTYKSNTYIFDHSSNNISIYLSVKDYANKDIVRYTYRLEGLSNKWVEWSSNHVISLNNLSPGKYKLYFKAKNHCGIESKESILEFKILQPWYFNNFFKLIYFLGLAYIAYFFANRQRKKHEKEKEKLEPEMIEKEKEHIHLAESNQAEIIKLQNEKLQNELSFKNQELTSFTYHLVNKNELISVIRKAILKLEPKFAQDKELKKEFKNIIHLTELNDDVDNDWTNFVAHFDQVHANFFKRLNEQYKDLSPTDHKMCTYLKMNLTTKEIATLMNISERSVETNRYRLRKKLGLDHSTNLTQFLVTF